MNARLATWITALTVMAVLALPGHATAQQHKDAQYPYILIDFGTLGGPQSTVVFYANVINERGTVVGVADTTTPDPYYPNDSGFLQAYDNPDPYIQHAFVRQHGHSTDLGTLPGATNSSIPNWINARGDVAGVSSNGISDTLIGAPEVRAVLWTDGRIRDLGTLGGNESVAAAVNSRDQVVGVSANTVPDPFSFFGWSTQTRSFVWQDGHMRDLGTLGGPDTVAGLVNERGQIAGLSYTNSTPNPVTGQPTQDPFLWQDGHIQDLGTLGGTLGFANDLNSRGEVVGQSNLAGDQTYHPFLWDGHSLQDLGTLGGNNGFANWINDAGDVVGRGDVPGSQTHHAFLWKQGVMTDLGLPTSGDTCDTAFGVNDADHVVGVAGICGGTKLRGFLWQKGTIYDVNTLFVPSDLHITQALYINDAGEIAGTGVLPNGDQHAVLMVPRDEADHEGLTSNAPAPGTTGSATAGHSSPATCAPCPATPARAATKPCGWRIRFSTVGCHVLEGVRQ